MNFLLRHTLRAFIYRGHRYMLLLFALCPLLLVLCPLPSSAQDRAYRLGPRDVITLTIYAGGQKELQVDLTVSSQGTVNPPFIGAVKADGLTIQELTPLIRDPLAEDYYVDPEVSIVMKEYHSLRYYISGAVSAPGLYEMSSEATLMELIAKAGGVLPERASMAYVLRDSADEVDQEKSAEDLISLKEPMRVDLRKLLDKGDMSHNLVLESGDVVYIPLQRAMNLADSKVYVEGEVKSPGVYDYQEGLTALNACILAGGFEEFAAPNRTRIVRQDGDKQEIIKINLNDVKKGKIPDIALRPGDRIHVPETWL